MMVRTRSHSTQVSRGRGTAAATNAESRSDSPEDIEDDPYDNTPIIELLLKQVTHSDGRGGYKCIAHTLNISIRLAILQAK